MLASVTVPGTNGNFQVLYNHAPIISSLEIGEIKIVEARITKLFTLQQVGAQLKSLITILLF